MTNDRIVRGAGELRAREKTDGFDRHVSTCYERLMLVNWPGMHGEFLKLSSRVSLLFVVGLIVLLGATGCTRKSGEAVVLRKERIAVRETTPSPAAGLSTSPSESVADSNATPAEAPVREMREDEIDVDGYVMKKEVRGTSKDPRAMDHEQWLVTVQMVADLRQFNVQTDKRHWERLKTGDRINVSYHQGDYTGTVWSAEID